MSTITMRFREIKYRRKVTTFCVDCRKKLIRTATASQTINPWNKNADGSVKTPVEVSNSVLDNLDKEAELLAKTGAVCRACEVSNG
jgi:hypothetical protein